ncbi:MAG TPA: cytochrome c [Terriglobales bacterium]|nr:cytochrome c [Terriglobales bacterium]
MRVLFVISLLLLGIAGLGLAQKPEIKKAPIKPTPAESGAAMFSEYCAVCHGKDGKGSGPAAPALKVAPPDLTTLARRNNGTFPAAHVSDVIRSGGDTSAHGSKDMPMWGRAFLSLTPHDDAMVRQRVFNLTNYIESLQQK